MKALNKKERLQAESERPISKPWVPGYGDMALEVVEKRDFDQASIPMQAAPERPEERVADERGPVEIEPAQEKKRGKRSRPEFAPDYRSPVSSKTTKLRQDQHRCLKEEVPEWVAEKYPEHPNLRRLVTIEFLTQMAIDELLTDNQVVERIVKRIQSTCIPG